MPGPPDLRPHPKINFPGQGPTLPGPNTGVDPLDAPFQPVWQKDQPGGYPSLDDTGQIPASELANAGGGGTRTVIKRFGGTVMGPTVRNYDVGVVEKIATVTAIRIKVPDGTSATVNVRKNGTTNLISADQTVAAATTYTTVPGGLLQNTTLAANDYLEILLTAVTGAVTEVAVQVVTTEQD